MTTVVNIRTDRYDRYIGRPSRWGNPFKIDAKDTRIRVIARYSLHLLDSGGLIRSISVLEGRRLGCWCAPKMCHGHVLAAMADDVLYGDELERWAHLVLGKAGYEADEMETIHRRIFERVC